MTRGEINHLAAEMDRTIQALAGRISVPEDRRAVAPKVWVYTPRETVVESDPQDIRKVYLSDWDAKGAYISPAIDPLVAMVRIAFMLSVLAFIVIALHAVMVR